MHRQEVRAGSPHPFPGAPLTHRPIFIVGAPRSGSTLLYQLMVDHYDVGYLANAHCRWPGGPSIVERRERVLANRPVAGDYTSTYGATSGDAGPSECGAYWYRFFPRTPHHVEQLPEETLAQIRASVRAFGDVVGRPLVYKNLYATVRMRPLAAALPEALFISISRDVVANSHSLLEGRRKNLGSYDEWFSVEPPGIEQLRSLPAHEQVLGQIRALEELIESDAQTIGADRFHHVSYEALCADAHGELARIGAFVQQHGTELAVRADVPSTFPAGGTSVRIDEALYQRLLEAVDRA
jgi:hypothetical protein